MPDVIRRLQEFNAGRDPERLQMKYRSMRSSTFAFLRGTCHLFYQRLPLDDWSASAPLSWICGDLHLENFGSFEADNGLAYFDISDFDEAVLAPASWDLARFLTSVLVAADSLSVSAMEAKALCKSFVDAYAAALALGKSRWVERETAQGLVRQLLDDLRQRQRARFLDARTERKGKKRILRVDGKKALPASEKQRARVTDFMQEFAGAQADPDFYKVLDVARRVAGTGSLGLDRYVILVRGKGSPDGNCLLDLRPALPSSLAPHLKAPQPKWKTQAHRIVELQQRMQAVSMAFLHPVKVGKSAYVLRGLQPSEDRVTLDRARHSMQELQGVMREMGNLVAWAHLRSAGREGSASADELIDFAQHKRWKKPLLGAARDCAAQVCKDWQTYSAAYDDGAFAL